MNIFNPDRIALAGGVVELGEPYLNAVRAEAATRSFKESFTHVAIERAQLGVESGAFGAAHLARHASTPQAAREVTIEERAE